MKVYVAYKWDGYDGRYAMGVYSERPLAQKAIEGTSHWQKDEKERREHLKWWAERGKPEEDKGPKYDIEEFELDVTKWSGG